MAAADPAVAALLAALDRRPEHRWSEADVTRLGFDLSTVRRSFKRQFGMTFLEMARQRRLRDGFETIGAGGKVIEAKNITKAYGDKLLFENLSFMLPPGGIVGVIGPNGAGKSTLFRMITGQETPDSGSIEIGDTVHLGYVDQSRDDLTPTNNVWEEISDGLDYMQVNGHDTSTRAYVGAFNFKGA
ncbi:MAG: ATP-binding cassette domain-containing protein, partial [Pseudomonadota bacterium]